MEQKIKIGFNNEIIINQDSLKKVCYNLNRRENFLREVDFYLNRHYDFMPKLYEYNTDCNNMYIIIEKIKGYNLFTVWSTLSVSDRQQVLIALKKICNELHKIRSKENYQYIYLAEFDKYLSIILENNIIPNDNSIQCLLEMREYIKSHFYMHTCFQIHGDLQFNNVIYVNNDCLKLVDFEHIEFAPIEKEIYSIFRMADDPYSFINKDNNVIIDNMAFQSIKSIICQLAPDIYNNKYFNYNLFLFEYLNSMRWIAKYPKYDKYRNVLFNKSKKFIG